MSGGEATVVKVLIAGEEYSLRAHATPEYTRQCAEYLDSVIRDIRQQAGASLERDRLAILAGLAIADQLFQARSTADRLKTGTVDSLARLAAEIESRLPNSDLAASS